MKTPPNVWVPILSLAGVAILVVVLLYSPSSQATPTITWTPNSMTGTIGQSQTKTEVVSFVSDQNLANVNVWIVPELRPYLKITPNAFSSVSAGTPLTITITLSASSTAPLNTLDGTIHLQGGASRKTIAKPLPMTLTICRCVNANGLSLNYPSSTQWQLFSRPLEISGPIVLNNFGSSYGQGGIIPAGGAEITVASVDLPSIALPEFIAKELVDSTVESKTSINVGGETATEVISTDSYTPSLSYKNMAVYVAHQARLHKFYLSYADGSASENEFITAFQQILASVKFTP